MDFPIVLLETVCITVNSESKVVFVNGEKDHQAVGKDYLEIIEVLSEQGFRFHNFALSTEGNFEVIEYARKKNL